jgi:hypothetical protein
MMEKLPCRHEIVHSLLSGQDRSSELMSWPAPKVVVDKDPVDAVLCEPFQDDAILPAGVVGDQDRPVRLAPLAVLVVGAVLRRRPATPTA